jgi:hypothetical protein
MLILLILCTYDFLLNIFDSLAELELTITMRLMRIGKTDASFWGLRTVLNSLLLELN